MNRPWLTGAAVLVDRMNTPAQTPPDTSGGDLPQYLESFLAQLRLLVGVPFTYFVPDAGLLPPEAIRFFHVDRSWTDRLVDGALAVGKVGTREQAHHHAHAETVQRALDRTERQVRSLQRGKATFMACRLAAEQDPAPAGIVTGLLLRSVVVSEHPDLEVRSFRDGVGLRTLRLARIADTLLLALFDGVPDRVTLEEPHRGVTFGVPNPAQIPVRDPTGHEVPGTPDVSVPFRSNGKKVLAIRELRNRLQDAHLADPSHVPPQTGSASFALAVLSPPWRQRFEGAGGSGPGPVLPVAEWALDPRILDALAEINP